MTPRPGVLARVRAALDRSPTKAGCFCIVCGGAETAALVEVSGETFVCPSGHRSPRAFLFDGQAVFSFDGRGRLVHQTAGALVRRGHGTSRQTLLFLRQRFPLLYTVPAGHVEIGRSAESEMRREVLEETGLGVRRCARLWPGEELLLEDPCRRGADLHLWHVFEAEAEGQPRLSEEGRIIGWYTDGEIRRLAARGLLALPVASILRRLGVATQRTARPPAATRLKRRPPAR